MDRDAHRHLPACLGSGIEESAVTHRDESADAADLRRAIGRVARLCGTDETNRVELQRAPAFGLDPSAEELSPAEREILAEQRATALLLDNLTEEQRRQFTTHGNFDVTGGRTGIRYRLWYRTMQNIEELDACGRRRCIWCVHPVDVALADVLLAQKVALELFELEALSIAKCYLDFAPERRPD